MNIYITGSKRTHIWEAQAPPEEASDDSECAARDACTPPSSVTERARPHPSASHTRPVCKEGFKGI